MAVDVALFVSKRASVFAAALLCLAAGRLLTAPSSGATALAAPSEVRVAITR